MRRRRSRAVLTPGPIAAVALAAGGGCGESAPPAPPAAAPWFAEEALSRGLVFRYRSGHRQRYLFPEIMGGGAALFDMDGDGDLDAYLVQGGSLEGAGAEPRPVNRLFRNLGGGRFEDATTGSGAGDGGYGMGVASGDFDGDGDLDLYVTNVGPNVLLRNEGDGRFTDVSRAAGVDDAHWGTSTAFADIDGDGDLDLFVANYVAWSRAGDIVCRMASGALDYCSPNSYDAPVPDVLYRNDGDGTFTDVSFDAGLRTAFGNGLGVVCGDFNGDGRVDIFVANDQRPNQLWENRGDGTFIDVAARRGCAVDRHGQARAGMGTMAVDQDDDGDLDLLVVNLRAESDSFFRNDGGGSFTEIAALVGLGAVSRPFTRFGLGAFDFDHDGRLDLFIANGRVSRLTTAGPAPGDPYAEPNLLFRGGGDGRFEEVRPRGGTPRPRVATSRAAAFGDVDGDGRVDLLVVNRDGPVTLLHNVTRGAGHWLALRVVNARGGDALGAVVEIQCADRTITRTVRTAYSYCAANDPQINVGLGACGAVDGIAVRWPDGAREAFGPRPVDGRFTLRRGEGS